jgi:hypothetical protein
VTIAQAAYRPPAPRRTREAATVSTADNRLASSSDPPRREVLNAMRALREMPPFAREREIDYGRYSTFPPESANC